MILVTSTYMCIDYIIINVFFRDMNFINIIFFGLFTQKKKKKMVGL